VKNYVQIYGKEQVRIDTELSIPTIRLRKIRELTGIMSSESTTNSYLLLGVLEHGQIQIQIPEIGKRILSKGEWFLLADKGASSATESSQDVKGVLLLVPINAFSGQGKNHSNSFKNLDCLGCRDRNASFFQNGKCIGRIKELATSIGDDQLSEISNDFLKISQCFELIGRIFEQPEINRSTPCRRLLSGNDIESVETAARFLDQNFAEDHTLNDICRYCYLNEFKLKKGFRERFGTTVFGYLRLKRMEKAKALLTDGAKSVIEIANNVGYTNASHFARAFRQVYGVNPGKLITANPKMKALD
jgi:AraC-like DNA-binding protein